MQNRTNNRSTHTHTQKTLRKWQNTVSRPRPRHIAWLIPDHPHPLGWSPPTTTSWPPGSHGNTTSATCITRAPCLKMLGKPTDSGAQHFILPIEIAISDVSMSDKPSKQKCKTWNNPWEMLSTLLYPATCLYHVETHTNRDAFFLKIACVVAPPNIPNGQIWIRKNDDWHWFTNAKWHFLLVKHLLSWFNPDLCWLNHQWIWSTME